MTKTKTFRSIKYLASMWKISELWIWALSITGWTAANGQKRHIERKWDRFHGSCFAEEDVQSWVDSHPAEYVKRTMPR